MRTGLGLLAAMEPLNTRLERDLGLRLAIRVGIHTGLVVVGMVSGAGRQEQLALGEVPNVASRLQGLAAPDTVLISEATYRLVEGYVTVDALGPQPLKGVATPVPLYGVRGESGAQTRLDVAAPRGLTPLVGREQDVALLLERWAQSTAGQGQGVLLGGDAGIGKSRLVQMVTERAESAGAACLTFRCSPYHTNSALYPVLAHLERRLQFGSDATPGAPGDQLAQILRASSVALDEAVPPFAAPLAVPLADRSAPRSRSPQRQHTLDALVAWLLAETARQPVLAVWEDLHWADPSTLELLGLVLDQLPTARLCLLGTARPEFRPPWGPRSSLTQRTLSRLTRPQVAAMVTHCAGSKALPAAVMEHIVARSDGVPLFAEELTKAVLAAGALQEQADRYELTGPLPAFAIPTTLHDALLARLDRLGDAKAVAQLGAVLGRTFSHELLRAVAPLAELGVWRGLGQLVEAEVLYQRGVPPQATYLFKHALLQEAAYQSLLRSTRQQYHAHIAQVLAERFPETAETQPELLAHHYTAAGLAAAAVDYWQRAGALALRRSAHVEAIAHLTKGLEVLQTLPDTPARTQHELRLQSPLIWALVDIKGYTAPEAYCAATRVYELASQVGDIGRLLSGLAGVFVFHAMRGEWHTARQWAEEFCTVAQRTGHPYALLAGHFLLGETLLSLGELARAREHLEHAMALYDPQQHRPQVSGSHQDLGVLCHVHAASVLGMLGYPDQARQRSQAALRLAQELAHPYSLTLALASTAVSHIHLGDFPAAQAQAEAAIALATEQGFALWLAQGTFLRGWALAAQGQVEEGMAQMRQGLDALRATGDRSALGREAVLAEVLGHAGQADAGLRLLAEALAAVPTTGERVFEAEMHRCKGELLLVQAGNRQPWAEAEACFRHALDVARQQQAKSWELRAAISLSRLWQRQGKRATAYELLAEVYGWFTEGFDTADLKEAKALLEELAR